jgi:hypothetical protein
VAQCLRLVPGWRHASDEKHGTRSPEVRMKFRGSGWLDYQNKYDASSRRRRARLRRIRPKILDLHANGEGVLQGLRPRSAPGEDEPFAVLHLAGGVTIIAALSYGKRLPMLGRMSGT